MERLERWRGTAAGAPAGCLGTPAGLTLGPAATTRPHRDTTDKILYQVLGPLNGGYLCSAFLDATSDTCSKTCPVRIIPPIDTNPNAVAKGL